MQGRERLRPKAAGVTEYAEEGSMTKALQFVVVLGVALVCAGPLCAQSLEVKRANPSEWTKGRFSEIITVNGPGRTIYLAGVGAEERATPAGALAAARHAGNPLEQCRYAYDKIKRLPASQGATLADVVKQVVYVTDIRYLPVYGQCRTEAYRDVKVFPVNTFLVVTALAHETMLIEIDVTAVVAK
jgi:2-iminobutanoate/2-iminopropanoate deaminase